jgi:signal transduction histidine kinase
MDRVLGNLPSNAIKYSPDGGEVKVALVVQNDECVLSVEDHGLGIPAEDLPHIFERYRRARNVAQRISGSGLGLSAVRDIVEQHCGAIEARSVEGTGTTFVIRLPLMGE